jgi:hypothetical protein
LLKTIERPERSEEYVIRVSAVVAALLKRATLMKCRFANANGSWEKWHMRTCGLKKVGLQVCAHLGRGTLKTYFAGFKIFGLLFHRDPAALEAFSNHSCGV